MTRAGAVTGAGAGVGAVSTAGGGVGAGTGVTGCWVRRGRVTFKFDQSQDRKRVHIFPWASVGGHPQCSHKG